MALVVCFKQKKRRQPERGTSSERTIFHPLLVEDFFNFSGLLLHLAFDLIGLAFGAET